MATMIRASSIILRTPLVSLPKGSCGKYSHVPMPNIDRKSTRLNSSHVAISYAVFCLKKKNTKHSTFGAADGEHHVDSLFSHAVCCGRRRIPPKHYLYTVGRPVLSFF